VLGTVAGGGEGISSFPTGYSGSLCIDKGRFCAGVLFIRAENSQFCIQNDSYLRPLAKMWYQLICRLYKWATNLLIVQKAEMDGLLRPLNKARGSPFPLSHHLVSFKKDGQIQDFIMEIRHLIFHAIY